MHGFPVQIEKEKLTVVFTVPKNLQFDVVVLHQNLNQLFCAAFAAVAVVVADAPFYDTALAL